MAKYENNYMEKLNRQLAEAHTRLEILTEYTTHYKDIGHYNIEEGVIRLLLGMPIATEKQEDDGYAE